MVIENDLIPEENHSLLFYRLMQIPEFKQRVKEIWNDIGKEAYMMEIQNLDSKYKLLFKSGNFNNTYYHKSNFEGANVILKEWLEQRYDFFDNYMK